MNDLMEFLTSTEIMVVYLVVAVALIICLIVYLFDRSYEKRRRRQNTRELNKLVEQVNDEMGTNPVEKEVPILEQIEKTKEEIVASEVVEEKEEVKDVVVEPVSVEPIEVQPVVEEVSSEPEAVENLVLESMEEELQYTDIEPKQSDAQAELQRLTETLEKAEEEANKVIELTNFEEEQEQNAIISLDELMTRGRVMYENDLLTQYEDEGNEPISLADLEAQFKQEVKEEVVEEVKEVVPEQMVLDDFNSVKTNVVADSKPVFKSSPVISPVYGIENINGSSPNEMELENTANYEKLDEEIKKTNEFLMTLRELQKNLD